VPHQRRALYLIYLLHLQIVMSGLVV
jgi:hypothetical protein